MSAHPFVRRGQRGWAHDEGHASGVFHTYDRLDVGGPFGARKVHVFLPRAIPEPLPVVYLHDGDVVFWRGGVAGKTWDVAGVMDRMAPYLPPMILVAIHPTDRNAEYTHVDWANGQRSFGRVSEYTDEIADRLKAFIDAAYPTRSGSRTTAVIGSSHGGLASFWMATRRPDQFGFAGCMSSS
ncbi:MAG: alpha/beta hydrolase-fold protein, partial [Myxococcota bacterium]